MDGLIADIQRCSLHDGPGIRTTVFLKGCNLRCEWCHNPETVAFGPEVLLRPEKCIQCGGCKDGCFAGARVVCGRTASVEQVLAELLLDKPFYGAEGGVTLSGGEPMCQPDFTVELLRQCRAHGLHTALESNMAAPFGLYARVLPHVNLLLADLKVDDDAAHRRWTGSGNEAIKANIRAAAQAGVPIVLHTPVVEGINDTPAEIGAIAAFAASLPTLVCYELLPYHPLGMAKAGLGGHGGQRRYSTPPRERMAELGRIAAARKIAVKIAGTPVK